jgi:hypothetical protein
MVNIKEKVLPPETKNQKQARERIDEQYDLQIVHKTEIFFSHFNQKCPINFNIISIHVINMVNFRCIILFIPLIHFYQEGFRVRYIIKWYNIIKYLKNTLAPQNQSLRHNSPQNTITFLIFKQLLINILRIISKSLTHLPL